MTHEQAATIKQDDDPGGSIFLPEREYTAAEIERLRHQLIFGRGVFHARRMELGEYEDLLREMEKRLYEASV